MNMLRSVRFPLRARGGLLALALPLLAGTGRGQGEAAAESLAQYLPADAVALLSLPDLTATLEDCRSLPLWKIGREKAVSDFLEPPLKQLRTWIEAERKKALGTAGFDPGTALEIKFRAIEVGLARLRMPEQGGPPEVAVAVRVDAGADFPKMKALLDGLKAKIPPGEGEVREETSGGKTFTVVGPPAGAKAPSAAVFWTGEGTAVYLAVGTPGSRFAEEFRARVAGATSTPPLASDPEFRACAGRVGNAGSEIRFFLRVQAPLDIGLKALAMVPAERIPPFLRPAGVKAAIDALGLNGLRAFAFASTAAGDHSVNETYVLAPGPRKGLLALHGEEAVDAALLARVPADACSFSVGGLRAGELWDCLFRALGAVAPEVEKKVSAAIAQFETANGVDLRKDLLGALGGQYVSYSMPMKGLMMGAGPEVIALVPLRDAAAFEKAARVVTDAIVETGAVTAKEAELEGTKIRSFGLRARQGGEGGHFGGLGMNPFFAMFTPAYAVKGNTLVVSLNRQSLQRAMRRLGQAAGEGAAANEGYRRFAGKIPAGASAVAYSDPRPTVGAVYTTVTSILPLAAAGRDLPIDVSSLPPAEVITKNLFGGVSYSKADGEGIYSCSFSPWGVDTVFGAGAVGAAGAATFVLAESKSGHGAKEEVVKATAGSTDPVERARRDLTDIKSGLASYKLDHDGYPQSLAELVKPSAEYPDGLLFGRKAVPKDPWGNDYVYEPSADAKSYKLRSMGPNGKDDAGEGDDVPALSPPPLGRERGR